MKPLEILGIQYDIVIIDNAICVQSITQDIIFENGYELLKGEAINLWVKNGRGFGPSDFISQYIDDNIERWCLQNLHLGKIETYNLN